MGDARLGLGVVCVQGQRSLPPHPCNSRRSPAKIAQVLSVEVFWSSQFVVAIGGDKFCKVDKECEADLVIVGSLDIDTAELRLISSRQDLDSGGKVFLYFLPTYSPPTRYNKPPY